MSTETEEKKAPLTGLKAYQEKQRLEREQKKGINQQKREIEAVQEAKKEEFGDDIQEADFGIDITKTYIFETIVKSGSFRNEVLSSTCKIFDGERMREIKYIPVADTIFVDEMGKRYDGYPEPYLGFHRDQIIAVGSDKRLVEYLLSHDLYDGNKNRISKKPPMFTLVNKADLEQRKEARHKLEMRALNIIEDTDIKELLPISRVIFGIIDTDSTTVKNQLRDKAKKKPEDIINSIDSPRIRRGYVMQMALDQGIIEVDTINKSLVWSNTKKVITEVAATKDLKAQLKEITDFSFTDTGNQVFDILKQKITV